MPLLTAFVAAVLTVHSPPPEARGTIAVAVAPAPPGERAAPTVFAEAVADTLGDAGFVLISGTAHARHVATLEVTRTVSGAIRTKGGRSRASSGGGMTYGNGVGVGIAVPLGSKPRVGQLVATELTLRITPQGATTPIWEGRAITYQPGGSRGDDPTALAKKLSAAIVRNLDGPSGVLVSVP